jgi:hypothetical protein
LASSTLCHRRCHTSNANEMTHALCCALPRRHGHICQRANPAVTKAKTWDDPLPDWPSHIRPKSTAAIRIWCIGDTRPFQTSKKASKFSKRFTGRLTMSSLKLLVATMMFLSMVFVLYPQGSANAAKYCAQLRGATAQGHPDCSFSTLDKCRARVRHRGGGHCYKMG